MRDQLDDDFKCKNCGRVIGTIHGWHTDSFAIVLGNHVICDCGTDNIVSNLVDAPPLRMRHAEWIQRDYLQIAVPCELQRAVDAYKANADRSVSLPYLQWWLIESVQEFVQMVQSIETEIGATNQKASEIDKGRELGQRITERLRNRDITEKRLTDVTPELDHLLQWRATGGAVLGAYSMLSAIAIGAWTAFEALAGDLWEDALNGYPILGARALNAEPDLDNDSDEEAEKKRKVKFTVPVWMLESYDYNLKHVQGTILRTVRQWDFAKREKAHDAYRKTFCHGKDDPRQQTLSGIFEDAKLRWLGALRNVLVHHGGRATDEFLRSTKGHAVFAKVGQGEQVPLDGKIVADLVENSIQCGMRLVRFVVDETQATLRKGLP